MTEEQEKAIQDIAPWMYLYEGHDDPQKSCMCWGYGPEGWFNVIKELTENLVKIDVDKKIRVLQIKEKFGGLRFYLGPIDYVDGTYNAIYEEIGKAEATASRTCMNCGAKGISVRKMGWISVLCDKCNEKRGKD